MRNHSGTALAEWGSAAVPWLFSFFHAFAESFNIICNNSKSFHTIRQLLVPNSRTNICQGPVVDTVPVELP